MANSIKRDDMERSILDSAFILLLLAANGYFKKVPDKRLEWAYRDLNVILNRLDEYDELATNLKSILNSKKEKVQEGKKVDVEDKINDLEKRVVELERKVNQKSRKKTA